MKEDKSTMEKRIERDILWKEIENLGQRISRFGIECMFLAVENKNEPMKMWSTDIGNQFIKTNPKWATLFQEFCGQYKAKPITRTTTISHSEMPMEMHVISQSDLTNDDKQSHEEKIPKDEDVSDVSDVSSEDVEMDSDEDYVPEMEDTSLDTKRLKRPSATMSTKLKISNKRGRPSQIVTRTRTKSKNLNIKTRADELAKTLPQAFVKLEDLSKNEPKSKRSSKIKGVQNSEEKGCKTRKKVKEEKRNEEAEDDIQELDEIDEDEDEDGKDQDVSTANRFIRDLTPQEYETWSKSNPELVELYDYLYKKDYTCNVCQFENIHYAGHFNHMRSHKDHTLCKVCDVMIPNAEVEEHKKSLHPNGLYYKCLKCERKYKNKQRLKSHYLDVHIQKKKVPTSIKDSTHWSKTHPDLKELWEYLYKKSLECNVCKLVSETDVAYYNHARSHKDYIRCKICDILVLKKDNGMEQHTKSAHPDGQSYPCYRCDRKFRSKLGLKTHFVSEHIGGASKFYCKLCDASYGNSYMLDRHMKSHKFDNSCFICNGKMSSLQELKDHMKAAHFLYLCIECSQYFVDTDLLEEHLKTHGDSKASSKEGKVDDQMKYISDHNIVFVDDEKTMDIDVKSSEQTEAKDESFAASGSTVSDSQGGDEVTASSSVKTEDNPECTNKEAKEPTKEGKQMAKSKSRACKFCGKKFVHVNALIKHLKLHNNKPNLTCEHCGKICKTDETYKRHILMHLPDEDKPYRCHICNKGFTTRTNVNKHQIVHSDTNHLMCEFCGKGYKDPRMLKVHRRKHTGELPYECPTCHKKFRCRGNLDNHKVVHMTLENTTGVMCDICGKTFTHRLRLNAHRKTHYYKQDIQCPLCEVKFKRQGNLQLHCVSAHTEYAKEKGWNMYQCQFCSKVLATRERLRNHTRTHTGEKPFVCQICGKSFAENGNLTAHAKIHSNIKPFECEVCQRGFNFKRDLRKHMQSHGIVENPVKNKTQKISTDTHDTLLRMQNYTNDELLAISIVTGTDNFVYPHVGSQTVVGSHGTQEQGSDHAYSDIKDVARRFSVEQEPTSSSTGAVSVAAVQGNDQSAYTASFLDLRDRHFHIP